MDNFGEILIKWYQDNKRDLPWRRTKNPYLIWISEIILQQTRVAQGYDYYQRFVKRFPDVFSLAAADEDEVMKYWQGLGYYSRARNLHAAARSMAGAGGFPKTYKRGAGFERSGRVYCGCHLFFCLWNALCCGGWECLSGAFALVGGLKRP